MPNRLASWSYDANGNVLQEGTVARSFTYDAENRQVTACLNCTQGSPTATYAYDGQGQRVSKTVSGQTTTYVYDAFGNLAAEYGAEPASACAGTCYVTTDHLGSTRLLTNALGSPAGRYDYEPFGQEIVAAYDGRSTAQGYTSAPDGTNPKFTGQIRDQETMLDWFNVRYYSGWQGRFQSPDPGNAGADPSNPQSWNGYAYVGNNPLSYTDPSGMFTEPSDGDPIGAIIGGLIDVGEFLGGLFGGGGPPPSIAPSLATPSSPIMGPTFSVTGWGTADGIPDQDPLSFGISPYIIPGLTFFAQATSTVPGPHVAKTFGHYGNLDCAGYRAVISVQKRTKAKGTEYGGFIYKIPSGSYSYSEPIQGTPTNIPDFYTALQKPADVSLVGWYHTHPAVPGYNSEQFGGGDLGVSRHYDIPGYLGTPSGAVLKLALTPTGTAQTRIGSGVCHAN